MYWGFKKSPLTLYTYLLAKMLQNGAKFIQKLAPGFKNHMRNLDTFRQAVESPENWNTFLQLKHYIQRIYLTLFSTTCVKIYQIPYVIFETVKKFSRHNSFSDFPLLALKFTKFLMSFFTEKVSFPSKFGSLFSVMRDSSSF